jgi:hypothetical protein
MREDLSDYFNLFALGAIAGIAWYFYKGVKSKASLSSDPNKKSQSVVFGVRG